MEKGLIRVEGMDCANCASTISRTLTKAGMKDVNVDFISGEVTFSDTKPESILCAVESINKLGYRVVESHGSERHGASNEYEHHPVDWKFYTALVFTIPLVLHMFLPFAILHNPFFQLFLSLPVMAIGFMHFGRSAFYSLRAGVPNMDVLIFTGSTAAFVYSVAGMMIYSGQPELHNYLFFETGATIITLVLLGNLIEQRSVRKTTSAIAELSSLQPKTARRIIIHGGKEEINECRIDELVPGDMIIVNTGDRIPTDGNILTGKVVIDESMLTGESRPAFKSDGDKVTGGTLVVEGNIRFVVVRTSKDNALSGIIALVREAQHSRPAIQKLGDRISAVFVPVVLGISLLTFIVTAFFLDVSVSKSLMNAIAVLVISCPCAMGLATPTAVMSGLGRAAQNGILIKGGDTIEQLSKIRTFVFDKTGTLTTGNFRIAKIESYGFDESEIKSILYSLEMHSSHPIARSLQKELKEFVSEKQEWKSISEDKGIGINATDASGNLFSAGSFQMVRHFHSDLSHDIYLLKNNKLMATIDLEDELKPDAAVTIRELRRRGFRVVLLSGDRKQKCELVGKAAGIDEIFSEKLPGEKLQVLDALAASGPVAMIGDGINDAPALAKASVGISISSASEAAIQSARVILLDRYELGVILRALRITQLTYSTIRQNLFWAFLYNVIAIPVAAAGMLSPMIGALSMAFSDVIVIGNSLRLRYRKIG